MPKRKVIIDNAMQCTKCKEIKPLAEYHRSSTQKSGYTPACKICALATKAISRKVNPERTKEIFKAARKRFAERHPERVKHWEKERNFRKKGLTVAKYEALVREQQGRCFICEKTPLKLAADHNHKTGVFRALLCRGCNLAIGHIYEQPEIAERIALYLREKNR